MAKKKAQQTAPVMTRGQLSRAERERRQIRNLYTAVIGVVSVAALLVFFVAIQNYLLKPNETVASVNDTNINRATYQKLRRYNVFQAQQQQSLTGQTLDPSALAILSAVDNEMTLNADTVNQLIEIEVLRQYAKSDAKIGLSASLDDLRAQARKDYLPSPTPPTTPAPAVTATSEVTGTATLTPTATLTFTPGPPTQTPTATPTLPPVPGAEQTAEAIYNQVVKSLSLSTDAHPGDGICPNGCPNISEEDYLHLIVEPQYLQEKVTEILVRDVVTQAEQVRAQHILTDTEEGAKQIIAMLDAHGADADSKFFTEIANTQSSEQLQKTDPSTRNGGDLGWFPEENSGFVQEFVDGAWPVKAGEFTRTPVKSEFGWHIIKVLEREANRPLSAGTVESAKGQAYTNWLAAKKAEARIISKVPTPAPIATQPAVQEPTQPPVVLTPATEASPPANTPAATPPPASTPAATP